MSDSFGTWTCPYCKSKNYEDDNYTVYEDGTHEVQCGDCEKHVELKTCVSVDHYPTGSCRRNGELPHELQKEFNFTDGDAKYICRKCLDSFYSHDLANGKYPKLKSDEYVIVDVDSKELL